MSEDEIILDYPSIEKEDILACLEYASNLVKVKSIYKASA
ncbi:putative toxin-antitoxin system, antitoxin component [Leptospira licerasiae serovar Varillal str. VAR 010]|uniref:Toxin-antitoxin system, antitoxin component n=2 Tax=Leptospira licerasiae TaxID=447106 RepID=A0ABN0HED6_9LEPT|nr:putative toxin-antitoxin system, antitoxin component [Leptospira licerasiae serovar Varillal str. VAR 010]EJZ43963.1 putative toxin-antitoxin system, antitoxin component [Leptospira licerasiae str. MMD4847]